MGLFLTIFEVEIEGGQVARNRGSRRGESAQQTFGG